MPEAPSLPLKKRLSFCCGPFVANLEPPEALAAQSRHEEVALPLRDRAAFEDRRSARRGFARSERRDRISILGLAALALYLGPAVVAARDDAVDLVETVLTELAGVELASGVPRQALHVAVSVGVNRTARERVVFWYPPL